MDWQQITLGVTVFMAWNGFLVGVIQWLINRSISQLDEKVKSMEADNKALIKALGDLRESLPASYVRQDHCRQCREEWQRHIGIIDSRLGQHMQTLYEKLNDLRTELSNQIRADIAMGIRQADVRADRHGA